MRKAELSRILRLIHSEGEISRIDLVGKLNLAPGHLSSVIRRLIQKEWILEGSHVPSGRGRRKVLLHVNPELARVIGVEIGRINSRIVVTDLVGKTLEFKRLRTELGRGEEQVLENIHREIESCLNKYPNVKALGIAHSGVIDQTTGTVLFWPKVSGWRGVRLRNIFAEKHKLTAVLEDSARTMAIAEQRFGYGKGQTNFIFVHAGVGIGAAIFVDGRLYTGHDGMAGELGHTAIDETGPFCTCGSRGCLEVYASGSAVIDQVRRGIEDGVSSSLAELAKNDDGALSIEAIVAAAESNDRWSERVLAKAATHFGTALANMVNLVNPARIVLGGTLFRVAKGLVTEPLLRSLKSRAFQSSLSRLQIEISQLGEDAAAVGACLLAANPVLEEICTAERAREKLQRSQARSAPKASPDSNADLASMV
jgi:predicted NBD/HSP70 family sugar kinase